MLILVTKTLGWTLLMTLHWWFDSVGVDTRRWDHNKDQKLTNHWTSHDAEVFCVHFQLGREERRELTYRRTGLWHGGWPAMRDSDNGHVCADNTMPSSLHIFKSTNEINTSMKSQAQAQDLSSLFANLNSKVDWYSNDQQEVSAENMKATSICLYSGMCSQYRFRTRLIFRILRFFSQTSTDLWDHEPYVSFVHKA